jgi:8-oxo-dGTP diphosphatase
VTHQPPDAFVAYTVVLLADGARYLLLHRSPAKAFMPGRWTGIGGLVEPHEHGALRAAALRELQEEAGIGAASVRHFAFRRVLLHARAGGPLTVLLYYTGEWSAPDPPACTEGTLYWVSREQFAQLDVIDTTRPVLPLLADDMRRDPAGASAPLIGVAVHRGAAAEVFWGQPND